MVRVSGWRWVWGVVLFCAVMATVPRAQIAFTTLGYFNGPDGSNPQYVAPVQGADGNLYGTTTYGGTVTGCGFGCGTVFKMAPGGNLTTLYNFCSKPNCIDGFAPLGSLIQATDGELYGTTAWGGANSAGTVFKITLAGKLTTLYSFCALANCADGQGPYAGLVQAANGTFYGTTSRGSTVFKITSAGKLTTLSAAANPSGALVQARNGSFYGENEGGKDGSIFEITAAGKLTTLFTFDFVDGAVPTGGLIQATNGNFYGVTSGGGNSYYGYCQGCGTVFKITPAGNLTTLYNFCSLSNCDDGFQPNGPLVQGTDGNFYGTTYFGGGPLSDGTVFEITPEGKLTTLYRFCALTDCADGLDPFGGLLQATNGTLYGTTYGNYTGSSPYGTIFSLSTGLGPFVSFVRNPAKVGQQFGILGYGLTGTSSVSLNGIPASFKPQSDTLLVATVPTSATTGYVTVTTPSGTLTSNVQFHVIP